jgi:glycosyltransferase involved in cell wall biosynthesis
MRAVAQLPTTTHLTILGSGPDEPSLRALAEELQIGERIEFAGFQPDIHPWLAQADAFVLSSLWEGLPVSVLEAASAGLPIVATSGPGTSEATPPRGRLVPVGNPEALAAAMAEIMALSESERHALGTAARQFASCNFALPLILDRWETLYHRLLTENPTPSRMS